MAGSSEYEDVGLGIRVIKGGKVGFGYCVPGNEKKAIERALELSKFSEELDITLPTEGDTQKVDTFDEKIMDVVEEARGAELTQKMIDGTTSVADDIIPTMGGFDISIGTRVVGNTEGLLLKEKDTGYHASVTASIALDESSLQAPEIRADSQLRADFEEVGSDAARKVDSMREKSEKLTGEQPVIVSPYALTQLIGFGLIPAVNGENVRKGKSVYQGKLDEKVASKDLLIKDDPTVDWGLGSGAFDDEGVISKKTPIISEGVLKSFIYDLKEGFKSSEESTANGIRSNFKNLPEPTHRNIVIEGRGKKTEELMPEEGIYVDNVLGAHTANPVSGDFSVVSNPAWLIEGGEKKGRVDGLMLSGNLSEVLESMKLADDKKKCFLKVGSRRLIIETPTALLKGITLSGK